MLILQDACEVIARESKRQMGAEEVPNNIERCKMGMHSSSDHHKHKGKTVADMNTRSARDVSSVSKSLNAYTQGTMLVTHCPLISFCTTYV